MTDTVNISGGSGTNTLTFAVQQEGDQSPGKDPSGVDFDGTINAAVPEPGSLMLLGTGLVSLSGMLLRRKRA